jgi:hypothetical protein
MIYTIENGLTDKDRLLGGQKITRNIALGMVRNYRGNQYLALVNNGYTTQTRSIHFTINELQEFLESMEDVGATGCRLYFSSVTQQAIDTYAAGHDELLGAMTVLMVATRNNAAEKHEELLNNDSKVVLPAFDFGTLCPPGNGCSKIMMSSGNSLDFDAQQD